MAKSPTLSDIVNISTSAPTINANNSRIETAFENTLSRDGSSPNQMEADLDMNGHDVLNIGNMNITGYFTLNDVPVMLNDPGLTKNWATYPENLEVDPKTFPGKFSAFHYMKKAEQYAADAASATPQADYKDLASLLDSTNVLTNGSIAVARKEGFAYEVVSSGGDLTTAGGVQLKTLPGELASHIRAYGATGTGEDVTSIVSKLQDYLTSQGGRVNIPKGTYNLDVTPYTIDHDALIFKTSTIEVNLLQSARNNHILFVVDTPEDTTMSGEHSRVPISVTVRGRGAQHASGVRSNLVNHSTDGAGNTAFYGNATSYPTALWSTALHGETRHAGGTTIGTNIEAASFTDNGSFYGAVIANTTANGHVSHPGGYPAVGHPSATGILVQGTVNNAASGGWVYGLDFGPNSMRAGGTDIRIRSTSTRHIHVESTAPASAADILLEANSANGIAIRGSYTGSAISIPAMQKIGLEPTAGISLRYNDTLNRIEFLNGTTVRGYVDMGAGSNVKMN